VGRPLKPNGDKALECLEEIIACSTEIQNIIVELALSKTTSQAAMSAALAKIHRLDQRITEAARQLEEIHRIDSERRRAALEREARKRME
jgi:hypothetical protein